MMLAYLLSLMIILANLYYISHIFFISQVLWHLACI